MGVSRVFFLCGAMESMHGSSHDSGRVLRMQRIMNHDQENDRVAPTTTTNDDEKSSRY